MAKSKKSNIKPKIILLSGLPSSGKSTLAEELVILGENNARVNKDKIREMVAFLGKSDKKRRDRHWEYAIQEVELVAARALLQQGFNIVVDDTNLKPSNEKMWKELAKDEHADFEVQSLLDVPIEECVRRDALRPEPVGRAIIYGMAAYAGLVKTANEQVTLNKPYIVADLDGTVFNIDHRLHMIKGPDASWERFFDAMVEDTPNDHVVSLIKDTYKGYPCVMVTGRPESHSIFCVQMLDYYEIPYHSILMRRTEDRRPDNIIKQEIIDNFLNKALIEVWIDDRACVLQMARNNGIKTINIGGRDNEF